MSGPTPLSVSALTAIVKDALTRSPDLEDVLVEGEVTNVRQPFSGHLYFTLKDEWATVRCVCWRSTLQRDRRLVVPDDGMRVIVRGNVDVYEQDGQYQLYVRAIEPSGVGAMAVAVRRLLERLSAEGLFAEAAKRPLPRLPRRVAVVTSMSGAALRDVLTVAGRRNPAVGLVVVATAVQGDGAEDAVVLALQRAASLADVDVVLLVRGGGSIEDLWAFQGERLARAIRACPVPVVTGVGHETDTTVADHAADRRAATPSAAAELVIPELSGLRAEVGRRAEALRSALRSEVAHKRTDLEHSSLRLRGVSPGYRLPAMRQGLDGRAVRLRQALLDGVRARARHLDAAAARLRLQSPSLRLPAERGALQSRSARLEAGRRADLSRRRALVSAQAGRLEALSPLRVLERGYSVTLDATTGAVVTGAETVEPGRLLRSLLARGELTSRVEGVDRVRRTDVRSPGAAPTEPDPRTMDG